MTARFTTGSAAGVTAAATALVGLALVLRLAVSIPGEASGLDRFVPVLLGAAALCAAGLSIRRAPSIAWLSSLAAAGIAALEILGIIRAWQPFAAMHSWPWLVGAADAALISAAAIAALEVTRPRSPAIGATMRRLVGVAAVVGVGAVIGLALWALATAAGEVARGAGAPDLWPIRWTGRAGLGLVALGGLGGAIADLAGPVSRARRRLSDGQREASTPPRPIEFLAVLWDELVPSVAARRRRVADDERARLAADLHARVLPDLRRAAAAVATPGVPASVAADVRGALAEVEQLMEGRQSIVLESFGLVAALEWLAERTEDRATVRVEVELDGADLDDPDAVPPDVRRALFRVALLAMDNVERHATPSHAALRLRVDAGHVRLEIADDGPGIAVAGSAARARSGRGLADMRTEAAAIGASLSVASDRGTVIELTWPARPIPEEPATGDAGVTARPEAPPA